MVRASPTPIERSACAKTSITALWTTPLPARRGPEASGASVLASLIRKTGRVTGAQSVSATLRVRRGQSARHRDLYRRLARLIVTVASVVCCWP